MWFRCFRTIWNALLRCNDRGYQTQLGVTIGLMISLSVRGISAFAKLLNPFNGIHIRKMSPNFAAVTSFKYQREKMRRRYSKFGERREFIYYAPVLVPTSPISEVYEDFSARNKQVSRAWLSNCTQQYSVGYNYLTIPWIPAYATKFRMRDIGSG